MERLTFSHYSILEKLGEGGMGVVYKSRDTHLDRFVAIKVLSPDKVADQERKQLFIREAKAASALNHPNIITIYDIDNSDGVLFIAMEYIAGRALDQAIPRGGMRPCEALKIGSQIASGLAAAHSAGIVHRDIKPANVMVTEQGRAKVLDFGVAKLTETEADESGLTRTLTGRTEQGTIVGTCAYMSPEQAQGKPVDARSDIFSFGTVLYEMVTGRRAFQHNTSISTLAAIINEEPPPLPPSVPHDLQRVIRRCLHKDPGQRFQNIDDVRITLEELSEEPDSQKNPVSGRRALRKRPMFWTAAAFAAIGTTVGVGWWWTAQSQQRRPSVARPVTANYSGLSTDPAPSPDGSLVAFASDRSGEGNLDIWIRHFAGGEPRRLTDDPTDDHQPCFSPDGSKIVFRSERQGGGLYVIPVLGGDARLLAKDGCWPRYSPDGSRIAYGIGKSNLRYFVIPADGGEPWQIEHIESRHRPPGMAWSPDGQHLLLWGVDEGRRRPTQDQADWWIVPAGPASSDPAVAVKAKATDSLRLHGITGALYPWIWRRDRVIFCARGSIWETSFSERSLEVTGAPRQLTFGTEAQDQPALTAGDRLVYSAGSGVVGLWELALEANNGQVRGPLRQPAPHVIAEWLPTLSAGGTNLAYVSISLDSVDVRFRDLGSGQERVLTTTPRPAGATSRTPVVGSPVISRDGSAVIYGLANAIYSIPTTGGAPQKLCDSCRSPSDRSRNGKRILYQYRILNPKSTVGLLDLGTGENVEILKHADYDLYRGHFSPDERWLVFHADRNTREVREFIAPFRGSNPIPESDWITLTDGKTFADSPRWSPDGNLIYYVSDRDGFRCIWAQRLHRVARTPLGEPFPVQHFHQRHSSLRDVPQSLLDLAVAEGRLVFTLAQQRGNIYVASLGKSLR